MNFAEIVMLIGLAIIVYVLLRAKHFSAMSNGDHTADNAHQAREAELEREVKELRERVKVLERIATDGRETRLLSDEIEKLRDE
jgi:hypothetical protein